MRMAGSWQCGRARLPTAPAAAPPSSCYGISPANPSHRRVGDDACHAPQRAPAQAAAAASFPVVPHRVGRCPVQPDRHRHSIRSPTFRIRPLGDGTSRTATVRPRSGGRAGAEVACRPPRHRPARPVTPSAGPVRRLRLWDHRDRRAEPHQPLPTRIRSIRIDGIAARTPHPCSHADAERAAHPPPPARPPDPDPGAVIPTPARLGGVNLSALSTDDLMALAGMMSGDQDPQHDKLVHSYEYRHRGRDQ
jgi:hypothetical protein